MAIGILLASGCVARGAFSMGGQGKAGEPTAETARAASSSGSSGRSAGDVVDAAYAKPTRDFDPDAFYTITTTVRGKEYALTFIPPENLERGQSVTNNASRSRVELRPLSNDPTQLWQFHDEGVHPGHIYTIWSKVSDFDEQLTGVLWLANPDNRFVPTAAYRQKHNRITVGSNTGETNTYWHVVAAKDGRFRIRSLFGLEDQLNKPREKEWPDKWNEARALEVLEEDGALTLVHERVADDAAQAWKVAKAGY